MMRAIWDFISSLKNSFRLLMACVVFFLVGSVYAMNNYEFIDSMNSFTIQEWMMSQGAARPGITWWLYPLILSLFLLGVNTFCCSLNRLAQIWALRNSLGRRTFLLRISPSMVHCFFLLVMFGHVLTSALGEWESHPLAEGGQVKLGSGEILTVSYISHAYYGDDTLMNGRIARTSVLLRDLSGTEIPIEYLKPGSYGGYELFLNMVKERKRDFLAQARIQEAASEKDSCNKERDYKTDNQGGQRLMLLAIKDRGLPLITTGFIFILGIMTWYFIELGRAGKEEEPRNQQE
ncbi:MAG TPA: hypothetical protein PK573_15850 [Spirochaetota bacterium]|nr:hypothetical protein [Spirochaetota bacterium]HRZ27969.1 hypothetical protein [Spirochaetota bacterium]HSA15829.1 hypothetical protein [Spirochaetota bacterium]